MTDRSALLAFLVAFALAGCTGSGEAPRGTSSATDSLPGDTSLVSETTHPGLVPIPARSPDLSARADSLERLDPELEVQAAIARGDRRLVGICGYVCHPPGVPRERAAEYASPERMKTIAGTSDAIVNADMARLGRIAGSYAERYNRRMLAHLDSMNAPGRHTIDP